MSFFSFPKSLTFCSTKCYGSHMPSAKARLEDEYDHLFRLYVEKPSRTLALLRLLTPFSDFPGLSVRFFLRDRDHRSRILCRTPQPGNGAIYTCLPLNKLQIHRRGSCLQLLSKAQDGISLELWANLKFSSIESRPFTTPSLLTS